VSDDINKHIAEISEHISSSEAQTTIRSHPMPSTSTVGLRTPNGYINSPTLGNYCFPLKDTKKRVEQEI